jgi:hypothetical protein
VLIDGAAMGLTKNRPYSMNAATPPSIRLMGTNCTRSAPSYRRSNSRPRAHPYGMITVITEYRLAAAQPAERLGRSLE